MDQEREDYADPEREPHRRWTPLEIVLSGVLVLVGLCAIEIVLEATEVAPWFILFDRLT
jgi:hypothetical protein